MEIDRLRRSFPYASKKTMQALSDLISQNNLYNAQTDSIRMTKLSQQLQKIPGLKEQLNRERILMTKTSTPRSTASGEEILTDDKQQVLRSILRQFSPDLLEPKQLRNVAETSRQSSAQLAGIMTQWRRYLDVLFDFFPTELRSLLPRAKSKMRLFFQSQLTNDVMPDYYKKLKPLFMSYTFGELYIFLRLFGMYFPDKTMMWFYNEKQTYGRNIISMVWRGTVSNPSQRAIVVLRVLIDNISQMDDTSHFTLSVYTETIHYDNGVYCRCTDKQEILGVVRQLIQASLSGKSTPVVIPNCRIRESHDSSLRDKSMTMLFTPGTATVGRGQYFSSGKEKIKIGTIRMLGTIGLE